MKPATSTCHVVAAAADAGGAVHGRRPAAGHGAIRPDGHARDAGGQRRRRGGQRRAGKHAHRLSQKSRSELK